MNLVALLSFLVIVGLGSIQVEQAFAQAIIDNGSFVQLGINQTGNLDVPGGTQSQQEFTTNVGLRYIPTNGESLAPGCLCEGWGVANADATTGTFAGYANVSQGGAFDLTVQPGTGVYPGSPGEVKLKPESVGTRFRSIVTAPAASPRVRITHDFHPSSSANLYEIDVTIENIGSTTIGDLRYRRVMDWDIPPFTFDEFVEIHVGNVGSILVAATTDGFQSANPLASRGPSVGSPPTTLVSGSLDYFSGSSDQGALFDFKFGALRPGQTRKFRIYYGAAANRAEALAALNSVRAGVYSLGIPRTPADTADPAAPAFIFGFNADSDGDGVVDHLDNCPGEYNPDQADRDGDGVGDACDKSPLCSNANQTDANGDNIADACQDTNTNGVVDYKETLATPANCLPGGPCWAEATFIYDGQDTTGDGVADAITTIRPDCFNTDFTVTDAAGNVRPRRFRHRTAYGSPTDHVTFQPGDTFTVRCDLSEMFAVLASGDTVRATYSNFVQFPDFNLWIGAVTSPPQNVNITGSPVGQRRSARIVFNPAVWDPAWASMAGVPPISAQISNIDGGISVGNVNPGTILLNGTVPTTGSPTVDLTNNILTVQFPASQAVQSLGTVLPLSPGARVFATVQGGFNVGSAFVNDIFSGQGTVLQTVTVGIDIKPGSFPNSINLGSGGTVPVAILSSPSFDARSVNPTSVTLASAPVRLKGKGLMASTQDVNGDGLLDLVVHVSTETLQLNDTDTLATLHGTTFSGIAIMGQDSIRVVP